MQVIDSHVHFWDPNHLQYNWLAGNDTLNKPYLPSNYLGDSQGIDVDGIVFVEANCASNQALDEVAWIETLDDRIQAIVAFAPLETGDGAKPVLEKLADRQLVKGIRRGIQSEAPGFSIQPSFIQGVQSLATYDLSFDILVVHHQLEDAITLVKQCPDIRFVLDHSGKPDIRTGSLGPWREHIQELAQFENVTCKLSGLITEANHETWSTDDLRPYIDHLLNTFGPQRLMYGSDYPVLNLAGNYKRWFDTLRDILSDLSNDEKVAIYFETAKAFYEIDI